MIAKYLSKVVALVALSLNAVSPLPAQVFHPAQPPYDVGAIVSQSASTFLKSAPGAVGLSIGVLKDDKTYTYNYGTIEKGKKSPPSADTLYQIASITKTFTGTILAQAVIEKKVRFDDDVRKYLDGDYPNLEFQGHCIQLGQLVNHNSGLPFNLPDIPENRPPFTAPISPATKEMLNRYNRKSFLADLHKVELKTVPGEKFSYSNTAAVLLSIVLERLYGMPYEEIVKQKIAGPLGMRDTTISLSESQKSRLANGYDENGEIVPGPSDMLLGAGALKSTVADFLKYARWELEEEDQAVKISHEPRFVLTDNFSLGLNWQMLQSGAYRRIWQEGNLPGFVSICMTFPELHMAVIVLANEDDSVSSHALTLLANEVAKTLDAKAAPLL
jgi:D-alanyl-D-alanine-carboxypeptidase/D-alanyl-D-alanine-endopeptidase